MSKWIQGDVLGLNEDFSSRLETLGESLNAPVSITSGYRSVAEQQKLWDKSDKTGKWVAAPGKSRHNYGLAVDIGNAKIKAMNNSELAKYKLHKPLSYENWHVEPIETKGLNVDGIKALSSKGLDGNMGSPNIPVDGNTSNSLSSSISADNIFDAVNDMETVKPLVFEKDAKVFEQISTMYFWVADNTMVASFRFFLVLIGLILIVFGFISMIKGG